MQHLHQISGLKIKGILTIKEAEVESEIKDASLVPLNLSSHLSTRTQKHFMSYTK